MTAFAQRSIALDSAAADVRDIVRDFNRYPTWANGWGRATSGAYEACDPLPVDDAGTSRILETNRGTLRIRPITESDELPGGVVVRVRLPGERGVLGRVVGGEPSHLAGLIARPHYCRGAQPLRRTRRPRP